MVFHVSRGDQPLARYLISNHTSSWRGWVNLDGGQYPHVQRITDDFIAQMLKDPIFKPMPAAALNSH